MKRKLLALLLGAAMTLSMTVSSFAYDPAVDAQPVNGDEFVGKSTEFTYMIANGLSSNFFDNYAEQPSLQYALAKDWDPEKAPCYVVETTNRTDGQIYFRCKDNKVQVAGGELEMHLRENLIEPSKTSTQYMSFPVEQFETPDDVTELYMTFECCNADGEVLASYDFQDPKPEE